jgi:PiT family inorganic phosphate transporter
MADLLAIIVVAILVVFAFDFFNGFHDAANAIATIVATKVLTPTKAVAMAAAGNFVGMVFITNAIAETIGKGIIDTNVLGVNALPLSDAAFFHSMAIIMGGVAGAIVWDIVTWLWGLPTSSSHALIGGIVGATVLAAGPAYILLPSTENLLLFVFVTGMAFVLGSASLFAYTVIIHRDKPTLGSLILAGLLTGLLPAVILGRILLKGLVQIVVYMVAAPLVGLVFAFGLALVVIRLFRRQTPTRVNHEFRRLQLVSSFFYSVTHGTNDAQKGMGIITLILVVAAIGPPWGPPSGGFHIPFWVIVGAHASISLGTFFGGWRIVRTMSQRVTHLRPWQGFAAETGGGIALASTALAGIPVSTTHVIASAIMGVGATRRLSAVRWGVARRIFWAWIITIPASAGVGMVVYAGLRLAFAV